MDEFCSGCKFYEEDTDEDCNRFDHGQCCLRPPVLNSKDEWVRPQVTDYDTACKYFKSTPPL
jgi:hypothetical protein